MEYNSYLQKWNDDDIMSLNSSMFKVGKFREAVNFAFTDPSKLRSELYEGLRQKGVQISEGSFFDEMAEGIDCEVLKLGSKNWQKGKIKIKVTVEFCSDEPEISQPESPLDDIRRMMNENN